MLTKEKRTTTKAKTSTTKVTPRFYSHFSVISSQIMDIVTIPRQMHTRQQNNSFHIVDWTRAASKCTEIKKKASAKRAKLFFVVKYANL